MQRNPSVRMKVVAACSVLSLLAAAVCAQEPDPKNWEFEIRVDKDSYKPGDSVKATAGMISKQAGPQGWSYGVKHDTSFLVIESATTDGTDVPGLFSGGFNQTVLIDQAGTKVGFIQAIILSFTQPIVAPQADYFKMAAMGYKVKDTACDGKNGDQKSKVEFTTELSVPGSPPVDINLTVASKSLVPSKLTSDDVVVKCEQVGEGGLTLKFDKSDSDLVADKTSLYDLKVLLGNTKTSGKFDVQGWSYGILLDSNELEAVKGEPGVDSKALKGGKGPDFLSYSLAEQDSAGKLHGVTVGAVIETGAPATAVLEVPSGSSKHIDTIQLRSKKEIPTGGASKTTTIEFTDKLGTDAQGGPRPLEVLIVVNGDGIVPDFGDTLDLTLQPAGTPADKPSFIRGDANNDHRVDIADGIWIVNLLFYGGKDTTCKAALDADGDGKRNITDAMYIFNFELQPGKKPGSLFPAPPAPFPNCGTVASVTFDDCPKGSTVCMP